jgi:glucose/arabinose dehydrogenase
MSKAAFLIIIGIIIAIIASTLINVLPKKQSSPSLNQPIPSTSTKTQTTEEIRLETTIATGLEVPWALAFLPDKSILLTERPGRVRLITNEGKLQPDPLLTVSVVQKSQGEGGLLGIVLDPEFTSNHHVYLYYTYAANGQETRNRVSRYALENNKLTSEKIIVDAIPGALFHDGGRIKFGPDNFLYITTGDSQEPSFAQSTSSTAGKILRITTEGKPAPGNPFGNLTYSYGHRNPQGIAWDSTGTLWETEHGRSNPTGFDEINLIEPGKNYGWDIIQGDEIKSGMITPKRNSGATSTWAPAGAAFVGNSFFFAGLKGETLYEAKIQNNQVVELKEHFKGQYGRIREVIVGPDGMLYITTSNRDGRGSPSEDDDKILRINPHKL